MRLELVLQHLTITKQKGVTKVSNFNFAEPTSESEAHSRLTQINADVGDIKAQIDEAGEDADPDWLHRARFARRVKRQEKAFLVRWVQEKKLEKDNIANTRGELNLASHFKAHRKLVGELGNLLVAVEDHLENDGDDTWDRLHDIVERIRTVSYS